MHVISIRLSSGDFVKRRTPNSLSDNPTSRVFKAKIDFGFRPINDKGSFRANTH